MTNKLLERIDLRFTSIRMLEANIRTMIARGPDESSSEAWWSWEATLGSLFGVARIRLLIAERLIRTLPVGEERGAWDVFFELHVLLISLDEDIVKVILAGEANGQ